ncbi:hypothetical protein MITS9509_01348 [Synechococcus sp. MIT S9509]|uniref:AAA family ATPase n=1 Tax=Synechococcus sp. MIT S9509 TaxID=1801630 RepID=UPI0007BBCFD4|nr:AAA family ATPase [Synechococcus sp. MIT S9509]KZR92361.1 hypothetical protein MITS9509_01348 [Synechococcus sp. MIT S9509]
MAISDQSDLLYQLDGLPLLPCGAGAEFKAPIDSETKEGLDDWPNRSFTPEEILEANGVVRCVGTRTGPDADHLLILDIDGKSAVEKCLAAGCFPKNTGWTIRRNTDQYRLKVAFHIPKDLRPLFLKPDGTVIGKKVMRTKPPVYKLTPAGELARDSRNRPITLEKQEALELFYGSGQCIVLGEHVSSNGMYAWDGSPIAIDRPSAEWLELLIQIIAASGAEYERRHPAGSGLVQQSGPGNPCPICGRNTTGACTTYVDGDRKRINCYEGQTFSPPDNLTIGDTITIDGQSYGFCGHGFNDTIGSFAKFAEHQEKRHDPKSLFDIEEPPLEELIEELIGELLELRLKSEDTWSKEMAVISELTCRRVARQDIERRVLEALADKWKLSISQHHTGKRRGRSANQRQEGESQQMLVDGFLPWKRDALLFGSAGVGKTTAGVGLSWSVISGTPFLDHQIHGDIQGKVLWIGSDGGDGAYDMWQNTAEDFGIAEDQRWIDGCVFWGADQQEEIGAWSCSPAGLLELKEELETGGYALVVIDSWKAVLELAGIDFGIGPVGTVVRLLQALIGQHCSALYLHHPSGNTKGKGVGGAGGNQNINQIPYAVHELKVEPSSEERPKCVRWVAHKLRGYQSREFLYRLTDGGFQIVEGDVITNCRDQILITIGDLEGLGTATTTHAIKNMLSRISGSTVSNNLTQMRQRAFLKKTGSSWHLTRRGKLALSRLLK